MAAPVACNATAWRVVLWIARLTAIAAIVPLMLIVFGENGTGPAGPRGWIYLALFPFGFSSGYLAGWRWPIAGGAFSLACLVASLLVMNRMLPWQPYLIWGVLSIPGILYLVAGWKLRKSPN